MTGWTTWWLVACADDPAGDTRPDPDPAGPTTPTTTDEPTTVPSTPTATTTPTEERFLAAPVPTDILFVVDNSCSMGDDQYRASGQLGSVVTTLVTAGVDFHLAVTTTDLDGRYAGANGTLVTNGTTTFLSASTPDPVGNFGAMMSRGVLGSSTEQGTGAAYLALETRVDTTFRRDDAAIHVVVVSDEPDLTRDNLITDAAFERWFDALADDPAWRTFSAFSDPTFGRTYGDLAVQFGGVLQDTNAADWSAGADGLVERFVQLSRAYVLAGDPDPDTLAVTLVRDGVDVPLLAEEWAYEPATRTLSVALDLEPGDELVVSYRPAP